MILNLMIKIVNICLIQEEGMVEVEVQHSLREKVRTLETYMVDIAQSVIKDAEQSPGDVDSRAGVSSFRLDKTTICCLINFLNIFL